MFSKLVCTFFVLTIVASIHAQYNQQNNSPTSTNNNSPDEAQFVEEVIVESNLNVWKKPSTSTVTRARRDAELLAPQYVFLLPINRVKRQSRGFGGGYNQPQYGGSSSTSNANANSHNFRPNGFDASNALASAQGFNTFSQNGGFGASSANTLTNSLSTGPFGQQAATGASGSQVYQLPNGQTVNLAFGNTNSRGPGNNAHGQSGSVSIS